MQQDFSNTAHRKPLISVIVPVYNVEPYLHRCVDSILAQTFTNFELLLINDGSTDKSGEICVEYAKKDERIRVFHKENGGVSSARNLGIAHAQGEWICFVDSDDEVTPNWLSSYTENLTADCIVCSCQVIFPQGHTIEYHLPHEFATNVEECWHIMQCLIDSPDWHFNLFEFPWNKLFKKSIITLHNIRFVEGMQMCEDNIFVWEYCLYINSVATISDIGICYYMANPTGLSLKRKQSHEYLPIINSFVQLRQAYGNTAWVYQHIQRKITVLYFEATVCARRDGQQWLSMWCKYIKAKYTIKDAGAKGLVKFLCSIPLSLYRLSLIAKEHKYLNAYPSDCV